MAGIREAVQKLVGLESGVALTGEKLTPGDMPDFMFRQVWDEIEAASAQDPAGTWWVFRHGSEAEFVALVNIMDFLGGEFQTDDAGREVIHLAKNRGTPAVLQATRAGFGEAFDRFWSETEPASPRTKARVFKQMMQRTGA